MQMTLDFSVPKFSGATYDEAHDGKRLQKQIYKIFDLMRDGVWRTYSEIAKATGAPEASISANLRNLRKESFGSHTVNRRPRGDRSGGLNEYQLIVNGSRSAV